MEKPKPCVIAIKPEVKKGLDELKILPRETYSQVIERLIKIAKDQGYVGEIENELSEEIKGAEEINKMIQDSEKAKEEEEPVPEKNPEKISIIEFVLGRFKKLTILPP